MVQEKKHNSDGRVSSPPRTATPRQLVLALLLVASMLLAPTVALAQEPVVGDVAPAAYAGDDATMAPSVQVAGAGAIAEGTALDVELSAPIDYDARVPVAAGPQTEAEASAAVETIPVVSGGAEFQQYMPLLQFDHNPLRVPRLGFGAGARNITTYPEIRNLHAGWYVDWAVRTQPARPGMEFVQMIRIHQKLDETKVYNPATGQTCRNGLTADRTICPYVVPHQYEYSPSANTIRAAARANPGAIWLIGNEMERYDWFGGRQDEIRPELYAVAYHDLRAIIKGADPTARIAIGGVIQFTTLRMNYLDRVWAYYQQRYGTEIPVDVFNVHNFIGSELCEMSTVNGRTERTCTGMGVPVGVSGTVVGTQERGAYYGEDNRHTDMTTFEKQIVDFRKWMKAKNPNNVNKPLIVTEYGVLYNTLCSPVGSHNPGTGKPVTQAEFDNCVNWYEAKQPWGYVDYMNPTVVQNFMVASFDYFNTARDCTLSSQAAFNCNLVQRWAWFGLEDVGWQFNPHGALINKDTGMLTQTGKIFGNWAKNNQ